jgi:hypothetical protein
MKLQNDIATKHQTVLNSYGLGVVLHSSKVASPAELAANPSAELLPTALGNAPKAMCHIKVDDARELLVAMETPTDSSKVADPRPEGIDQNNAIHLVGWTLILMDALDTKERWGRAKRWESPSCDLTGCDNLSEEELYSETHLSISKVSKAHVSAAEAGARLVAVSCAFSGNGSRFGYSRLAASRVLQKVRHQVKGRKTGVVLFAEEVSDPAEHRQVYAAHQLALAKGVGVMRQMSLEGAKSMSSSEKFCAFGLIRATDPTWQKPWSKETVAQNYCAVSWNGAQEIFWP